MVLQERRRHPRTAICTKLRFYHDPSRREFDARGADESAGGMLLYVPMTVPVKPGQPIRLLSLPDHPAGRPATVVRVDRRHLLAKPHPAEGALAVGVQFSPATPDAST